MAKKMVDCLQCARYMPHSGRGLCSTCRGKSFPSPKRPPKIITCAECGRQRPHNGRGLCQACYVRQRYAEEPDYRLRRLSSIKKYVDAHPEEAKARITRWSVAHRPEARTREARWKANNPEKVKEYNRRRYRMTVEQHRAAFHSYQARKRSLPATFTVEQWKAIIAAYGGRCAYCGTKPKVLTQDHVIPTMRGGAYTVENIVPACKSCNSRKGTREPMRPVQTMML